MSTRLFAEFAGVSKEQWVQQVQKDLKGRFFDELLRTLGNDVVLEPFYTRQDNISAGNIAKENGGDWAICEAIKVTADIELANKKALSALMGGANALTFELTADFDVRNLGRLLQDIELTYIGTHFDFDAPNVAAAQQLLEHFVEIATDRGNDASVLKGSLFLLPKCWENAGEMANIVQFSSAYLPAFKALTIQANESKSGENSTVSELSSLIMNATELLDLLLKSGVSAKAVCENIQFLVDLDMDYFVQIAKLRALRLLWANVLNAYGLSPNTSTHIAVQTNPKSYDETDHNTNKIRMTTIAMSAVLGAADRITLQPTNDEDAIFASRIARNVQHILKMESYMNIVADPAAGSYYIENLTNTLAEKTWATL
jgi:methylmalonyl-CoA mutase